LQRANQPRIHACCRGYRPHPDNYTVILPARYLHGASDNELAQHYARCPEGRPACRDQVLAELHRRDVRQDRREAVKERRRIR
jgi:hypothetical protein